MENLVKRVYIKVYYLKVKSIISAFIHRLKENGDEYKASEIILRTKNIERLTEIINIIAKIPEIKIDILGQGKLDPESIAKYKSFYRREFRLIFAYLAGIWRKIRRWV